MIQIDSHSGARPKCAKDQGKIFDLNNGSGYTEDLHARRFDTILELSSYGELMGFLGINCRHHKWLPVPGVMCRGIFQQRIWMQMMLYKQTQVQRALRGKCESRNGMHTLDAAGDHRARGSL